MSLKVISAYLMLALAGKEEPSSSDIQKVLSAVGGECDEQIVKKLLSEVKGKTLHEIIAAGMGRLQSLPSGGGGGSAPSGSAGAAAPAAAEPEPEAPAEEEEEDDMGFSLFD